MNKMQPLTPGMQSIRMTSAFKGYNHNDIIADGEMYDMTNMSGDYYPLLSLRQKRGITSLDAAGNTPVPLTGIHGRDQLVFIRGRQVYYNMIPVDGLELPLNSTDPSMLPKKIVSMGAYVCIWPDKMYFNTIDQTDCGSMERLYDTSGSNISLCMCRGDGSIMSGISTGPKPENPSDGDLWIDSSGENDVLKQYSEATKEWVEVATTFVRIEYSGIGANLKEYDVVDISGLEYNSDNESDAKIRAQVEALNGSMIVYFRDDDYIVVAGLLSVSVEAGGLVSQTVSADLKVPDLDYICESNNRLWGCKYGMEGEQVVNEIRASKLGDFRNWNCFMGLSTDSYTASVGTDGVFTGAITQRGYPVFFKENCIHRVSGQTPSSFSIQTTVARGVQRGSWRSVAVVSENIYYKARNAVMVYDGNMPEPISAKLGSILYGNARAGVLGDKYYISMADAAGNWTLFNYDTKYGTWYKEDAVQALGFGTVEDELVYIDEEHNTLVTVRGSSLQGTGIATAQESELEWSAEFDLFGTGYYGESDNDSPARVRNSKYLSLFKIRVSLAEDAWMKLWIRYDDNADYEYMGMREGTSLRTFVLPVIPKRCDHLRFKLTGYGDIKIYDISRILEVGGDG